MSCKDCLMFTHCRYDLERNGEPCEHFKSNEIKTKYDRIRNMDVEELAEFMYSAPDKICFENCTRDTGNKYSCKFGEGVDVSNCLKCMKQYLESEVTE